MIDEGTTSSPSCPSRYTPVDEVPSIAPTPLIPDSVTAPWIIQFENAFGQDGTRPIAKLKRDPILHCYYVLLVQGWRREETHQLQNFIAGAVEPELMPFSDGRHHGASCRRSLVLRVSVSTRAWRRKAVEFAYHCQSCQASSLWL